MGGHRTDLQRRLSFIWAAAMLLAAASLPLLRPPLAQAQTPSGQQLFDQRCKTCHTIGGGRTVGPDLKGIASVRDRAWLVRFIVSPDQLISQGDPIAKQLVEQYKMPMPNLGLSVAEAAAVLAYVEAGSGAPASVSAQPAAVPGPGTASPAAGDPAIGKGLFRGEIKMANGGGGCLSCHNASGAGSLGGGSLARDLGPAYSRLGEAGITSILKAAPFPAMAATYSAKPLTDTEIAHLVAFFKAADGTPAQASSPLAFIIIGVAGLLLLIALFQLLWRGRLSGVRRNLVAKGGSK